MIGGSNIKEEDEDDKTESPRHEQDDTSQKRKDKADSDNYSSDEGDNRFMDIGDLKKMQAEKNGSGAKQGGEENYDEESFD